MPVTADMTTDEAWTEWIYLTCECLDRGITVGELCNFIRAMDGDPLRLAHLVDSVELIALMWETYGTPPRKELPDE